MPTLTQQAQAYEPTGDPDHVAYGKDFHWRCSCGKTSNFFTSESRAVTRAQSHEDYCDGTTTVDVL